MKSKENTGKRKKRVEKEDLNWKHVLKEPYCMIRTYGGLALKKKVK